MIVLVKLSHTLVWAVMAAAVLHVVYCGLAGGGGRLLALSIFLVLAETAVLLFNKWRCPLTDVAARYAAPDRDNFDIYLPEWLARHNKLIFGGLFFFGLLLLAARRLLSL